MAKTPPKMPHSHIQLVLEVEPQALTTEVRWNSLKYLNYMDWINVELFYQNFSNSLFLHVLYDDVNFFVNGA